MKKTIDDNLVYLEELNKENSKLKEDKALFDSIKEENQKLNEELKQIRFLQTSFSLSHATQLPRQHILT